MAFPLNVAVASAVRTPVGRAGKGTLRDTRPDDLAAVVMKEAVRRVPGLEPKDVQDVLLGCAFPEGEQGFNVARNAVFLAQFPDSVTAETINRFCSSGLQAIAHGAMQIQTGISEVVLAGGVESMSMVPMTGNKLSLNPELADHRPEAYIAMGLTAERVAEQFKVSRQQQDEFAFRSHQKAIAALDKKVFADETVTVKARTYQNGEVKWVDFAADESPRRDTTLEGLAKLRPAFSAKGTVTAGNASPMNDGAAATILMSDAKLNALGIKPLGRMRGYTVQGVPPEIMGIGPVPAIRALLQQTGLKISDIDLFEINEAFASQAFYSQRELGIPDDRINVNGGAIALGHPLGCTGAKLTAQLLYELRRRGGRYGIVSMCIGGGMGAAGLYEVTA
ncbi:MAG: thiolase family protein [Deltaproteobacteria bacterium]|jgi:acetyl-CoA acyltransferase|nr:thiolase family protein [Deltaproteobacteria bacterium]